MRCHQQFWTSDQDQNECHTVSCLKRPDSQIRDDCRNKVPGRDHTSEIDNQNKDDSVSSDIKLETETEDGVPTSIPPNMYHPRRALHNAIVEWLVEFQRPKQAWGPITKPQPPLPIPLPLPVIMPSVNTCMSVTSTTTTTATPTPVIRQQNNQLQAFAEVCSVVNGNDSLVQPISNSGTVVMNSLISDNKVLSEPMDCNSTPTNSPAHSKSNLSVQDVSMAENIVQDSGASSQSLTMQVEQISQSGSSTSKMQVDSQSIETLNMERSVDKELTLEDLSLMCDLFYLPFEHGSQGIQLLQEFNWLKMNAHLVTVQNRPNKFVERTPEVQEWYAHAAKLEQMSEAVNRLFVRLTYCNNRELVYDLYPYVWDMRGVISLLNSYIKWLASGEFPPMVGSYTLGNYTWFSKGWKESFMSGDQEPWVFRGGLTADLQRLIPVDGGSDLFVYKAPEVPCSKIYTVRPLITEDETQIYNVCLKTCLNGEDGSETFSKQPNLPPDRLIGAFITLSPELCFVVEDEFGIVGYAVAALDARQFYAKVRCAWLPEMCHKYPKVPINPGDNPVQDMVNWFHSTNLEQIPDSIHTQHTSVMCCSLLPTVYDQSVAKRLIICLLAALRANGSFGVYVSVNTFERHTIDFYGKLGFIEIFKCPVLNTTYLGRTF